EGRVAMSGVQALARVMYDQKRADEERGLHTAGFVSGYRGSPLGGLDMTLFQQGDLLDAHEIKFTPGLNEDLATTAVYGSQFGQLLPNPRYAGVFAMWYGKSPGVDRSTDALRHGNFHGASRFGGVLYC